VTDVAPLSTPSASMSLCADVDPTRAQKRRRNSLHHVGAWLPDQFALDF
jgi:hypothetical protein